MLLKKQDWGDLSKISSERMERGQLHLVDTRRPSAACPHGTHRHGKVAHTSSLVLQ